MGWELILMGAIWEFVIFSGDKVKNYKIYGIEINGKNNQRGL